MDRTAVRPASKEINKLILDTILEAEKVLLSLPTEGDSVEVQTASSRMKPKQQNAVARKKSDVSSSDLSTARSKRSLSASAKATALSPSKAEIVPGSVHVRPLNEMTGVVVDVGVRVSGLKEGDRFMELRIECPQFNPKRICIDGKWRDIV